MRSRRHSCSAVAACLAAVVLTASFGEVRAAAQQTASAPRDRPVQTEGAAGGTITGRVVDANSGAPVRRAIVGVYSSVLGNDRRGGVTDGAGRFTVTDLPAGRYDLAVFKYGYYPPDAFQSRRARPPRVDVVAGSRSTITLSLLRGGAISGRVTDDTGEPLAHVRIQALPVGGHLNGPMGQEQSDDLGHYRLYGLAPGDYIVQAVPEDANYSEFGVPDQRGLATTYYPGTPARAEAQRLRVGAGSDVTGVHITLVSARLARVTGTVTDSRGRPVTSGFIMVSEQGDGFGSSRSGGALQEDGRFKVEGLPPGTYTLVVMTGQQDDPETESAFVPVAVASENLEGIGIVTAPPAIISGRLVFDPTPDDPAVTPARFPLALEYRHAGPGPMPFGGTTSRPAEDGTFQIRMHGAGRADPRPADQWPGHWILDTVLAGGVDVTAAGLEFSPGDAIRDVQIVLTNHGGALTGTVSDDRGAPAPHAYVVVMPENPTSASPMGAFTTEANDEGRYSLAPMRSGAYVVAAVKTLESGDPQVLERLRPSAVPFQLARGEKKVLNLRLGSE